MFQGMDESDAHLVQSGSGLGGVGRTPPRSRGIRLSLEGESVHQAALAPGRVQTAIELQRACLADIALEDFAVIACRLDGLRHPLVVEAQARSEVPGAAKQALDGRYVGFRH